MFASFVLAASLLGQFTADPAPDYIPIRYVYFARDPKIEAAMRAYAMSPTDGEGGYTRTRFERPFRTVPFPAGTPDGVYYIYLFPGMPLVIPTR